MAKNLSTFAIAELLQVDPGSVANWIDQDLLKAHRTPGGHRRVSAEDLVKFLRRHKMPTPSQLRAHPYRVLIVDGQRNTAQLLSGAIKASHPDMEVLEANDAFSAGSLTAAMMPDTILLDMTMPGLDGYSTCRFIKNQPATRHIHILAMAERPTQELKQQLLNCGARACLARPPDVEIVLKELEDAF